MEIKLRAVLQRELKARNESINAVAAACKIPTATMHGWYCGVLPSAKNMHLLQRLADYLGLSLTTLLFNVRENGSKSSILFSSQFVDGKTLYRLTIEKVKE